jgi:hypothetical protein
MTRYIFCFWTAIITGLLILIVPNFIKFFRTYKRRNRICLGIYFLCLGVLTIMINIVVILNALSCGIFYIWLNYLDEKNYEGSRFSPYYADQFKGYAPGIVAILFVIGCILEYLD